MNQTIKPDFKILDGLRGIAATYVVIHHCRGNLLIGGSEYAAILPVSQWSMWEKLYFSALQSTALGREFVIFFFVLSGFSIAYSLQRNTGILKFYSRRLIRLYPPYLTALAWAAVVFLISSYIAPVLTTGLSSVFADLTNILSNLFYIPRGAFINQFWSLTHEVIFYLLIPIAILNRKAYYLVSVCLYLIGWIISTNVKPGNNLLLAYIFEYNIFFVLGIWLFHNYVMVRSFLKLNRVKVILLSTLLFITMVLIRYITSEDNKITIILSAILSVVLIIHFLENGITNRLMAFLGAMSYTIYISHMASIFLFKAILINAGIITEKVSQPWVWPIGVLVCVGISYCMYVIAEKPTKRLLDNLRNKIFQVSPTKV